MGLLSTGGPPMMWGTPENQKAIPYVREHGITQFLNLYKKHISSVGFPFLWGEEVEHTVVSVDDDAVRLSLTADSIIKEANATPTTDSKWLPEYGSFMVESTPAAPYSLEKASLLSCEGVLQRRYDLLRSLTSKPGDKRMVVTLVAFPRMGQPGFVDSEKPLPTMGEYSNSIFCPEEVTNQTHPRFANLTRNIRLRRGRKVCIQIPMFIDKYTMERSVCEKFRIDLHPANGKISCAPATEGVHNPGFDDDDDDDGRTKKQRDDKVDRDTHEFTHLFTPATHYYYGHYYAGKDRELNVERRYEACPCPVPSVSHPCVYMDSMAFGMGMSCLQVTMQMPDADVARHIFDQLSTLCPMFLAITAATPVQKGFLVESDVRWMTIAASVDDRKRSEVPRIIKSRYDSVSLYISPRPDDLDKYNDNHVEIDEATQKRLRAEGIDERLANHISHLFIRDPLVIYDGRVDTLDDANETDHFENVQSTNWQTVRFKPPPPGQGIGWRVEFRVMEVHMTPFENAAFSTFIVLLTRAIMKYDLWLYIPMSKVDENMGRAHQRDSVKLKYWFTRSTTRGSGGQGDAIELTMDELFNGGDAFAGFIPIVQRLVREEGLADPRLEQYFELIRRRANGTLQTTAAFLREFVTTHADYKQDSQVSALIARDMVLLADDLAAGKLAFESFLPAHLVAPPADNKQQQQAPAAARAGKRNGDKPHGGEPAAKAHH